MTFANPRTEVPDSDEKCFWCDKPAVVIEIDEGCKYCGGGDCGDSGDRTPVCDDHRDTTRGQLSLNLQHD